MSWQSYIDDQLLVTLPSNSNLVAAAILGQDGSVWAQSPTFPSVSTAEINAINSEFAKTGTLAAHGLYLGGEKYMVIIGEDGAVIRGKKGTGGVTIKKTVGALVIGIYAEPTTPGECNIVVENLGDYLISVGI